MDMGYTIHDKDIKKRDVEPLLIGNFKKITENNYE